MTIQEGKNVPHEMTVTIAQAKTLYAKWVQQDVPPIPFMSWLETVMPVLGGDGAVTVHWCGMWLCIEKDGYCHT